MVDMKAKLRELGSSVSDARKRLLRYNIYLKKKLAKAIQERRAWREQQLRSGELGAEQDTADDRSRGSMTPQGVFQRSAGKMDTMSSRPSHDRGQ
ncbi:hypothetical protein JD844_008033 [Phrynosoma platyrhinos]|uniref:Uncharacterized protein n=1 Tax=Phrynosoma platyrhinos TaxID=52577 RepID=A0ABQ7TDE9_PHRPL|nr:hypothetical protein JD844_008033 [Phrynosoma platyrhinos]